jgi:hypothetical protein
VARLAVVSRYLLLLLVLYHEHLLPLFVPIAIWLIYWWFATGKLRVSLPIDAPIAAYLLLGYITTILSDNPTNGMLELIYTPFAVAVLYRVAYGLRHGEFDRPAVVRLITTAAILIMAESAVRLAGRAAGIDWLWHTEDCPWCDAYARSWRVWLWSGDWMTYALILLVATIVGPPWLLLPAVVVAFWSGSRSAWLSFGVWGLLSGIHDAFYRRYIVYSIPSLLLLISLPVFFAPMVMSDRIGEADATERYVDITDLRAEQMTHDSGRSEFMREANALWLQSPLWGSGWGSYWFSSGPGRYETFHPHHHTAYVATSHGAIGVALLFVIVVRVWWWARTRRDAAVQAVVGLVALYSLFNSIICSMLIVVCVVFAMAFGDEQEGLAEKNGVAEGATP